MKKFMTALLALSLLFSLAGCGDVENDGNALSSEDVNSEADGGKSAADFDKIEDGLEDLFGFLQTEDPRRDLFLGEWYPDWSDSDTPFAVFNDDGTMTNGETGEDLGMTWDFSDGYLIFHDKEDDKNLYLNVLYVDEYEFDYCAATTLKYYKKPARERISEYAEKIVGEWYMGERILDNANYIFNSDGTFKNYSLSQEAYLDGTWNISGENLVIKYDGGNERVLEIESISENKLSFKNMGVSYFSKPTKEALKCITPLIYEGIYETNDGGIMKISNKHGNSFDMEITSADGQGKTVSGKSEIYTIQDENWNSDILNYCIDFTPDGQETLEQIGYRVYYASCHVDTLRGVGDNYFEFPEGEFEGYYEPVEIQIPNGTKIIGIAEFMDCDALKSITIPTSVTLIGENAFSDCDNLTIHAPVGSYAEQYAKENNIPFEAE